MNGSIEHGGDSSDVHAARQTVPEPLVQVLYENGPCLVVFKPGGVLTQAPRGIDSLEVRIKRFLAEREQKPGNIYLGVPHRLDRPVSGAMVFGLHVRATQRLARQFERRTVRKVYWACVEGVVEPAEGTWRDQVRKLPGVPRAVIVPSDDPEGRPAVLHYRTLGRTPHGSWLEIELETGRYHQVRVQCSARGHGVLGDELYGSQVPFGPSQDEWRLRTIALHARQLGFLHPMTKEPVSVTAEVPEPWKLLEFSL
jgi:23S rRNA pseudouridine1911/1915/1917 synthase